MAMQRKIDSLRRVTVPANWIKKLNFSKKQAVEMSIQYGKICITSFENQHLETRAFIGIVRNLDRLNRFIIPPEFLNLLGLKPGDSVTLELENPFIKIKK